MKFLKNIWEDKSWFYAFKAINVAKKAGFVHKVLKKHD